MKKFDLIFSAAIFLTSCVSNLQSNIDLFNNESGHRWPKTASCQVEWKSVNSLQEAKLEDLPAYGNRDFVYIGYNFFQYNEMEKKFDPKIAEKACKREGGTLIYVFQERLSFAASTGTQTGTFYVSGYTSLSTTSNMPGRLTTIGYYIFRGFDSTADAKTQAAEAKKVAQYSACSLDERFDENSGKCKSLPDNCSLWANSEGTAIKCAPGCSRKFGKCKR